MVPVSKFRYQEVLVLGLGRTGLPVVWSLLSGQARVIAIDDNLKCTEEIFSSVQITEMLYKDAIASDKLIINPDINTIKFKNIKAVIASPGIPIKYPRIHPIIAKAKEYGIPILSDIELLNKTCMNAKYIAITGTNGKSTTTSLIGHIIKNAKIPVQVGGNIGISALSLEPLNSQGIYVLETSSFQLDLLDRVRFNIAILLNITPDHLDRHPDFASYKAAKLKVFDYQMRDDYAIISIDHSETKEVFNTLAVNGKQKLIPISTEEVINNGVSVIDGIIYDNINPYYSKEYKLGELKRLPGKHNAENIAAAYAASKVSGVDEKKIIKEITSFQGLAHRMELVVEKSDLKFINDSKATNTDAAKFALEAFDDIYWIAGGISKDGGIECLSPLFNKLKHVYLIGKAAPQFAEVLKKYNIAHTEAHTLDKALELIHAANISSGVVLLSPACASLDQWKNYEHRGEGFKEIVQKLWG